MDRVLSLLRSMFVFFAGAMILPWLYGFASGEPGQPAYGEVWLQNAATPVMNQVNSFMITLMIIAFGVSIFVLMLLLVVIVRYNSKTNPKPASFSHNNLIEVLWTAAPIIILIMIVAPSLRILYDQLLFPDGKTEISGMVVPASELTVKATGHQWYWSYSYPDKEVEFDSLMVQDADLKPGQPRLLAVDNQLVVPVKTTVRVIVTSQDVLHAFAVPSFGIKIDAIPGRLNETWFYADNEGVYYGQCSELCGRDHAFMPIAVRVVSKQRYDAWITKAVESVEDANSLLSENSVDKVMAKIKPTDNEK